MYRILVGCIFLLTGCHGMIPLHDQWGIHDSSWEDPKPIAMIVWTDEEIYRMAEEPGMEIEDEEESDYRLSQPGFSSCSAE